MRRTRRLFVPIHLIFIAKIYRFYITLYQRETMNSKNIKYIKRIKEYYNVYIAQYILPITIPKYIIPQYCVVYNVKVMNMFRLYLNKIVCQHIIEYTIVKKLNEI